MEIKQRSERWFGSDRDCQAWEPSGDDFLSPALTEAVLMMRVLPRDEYLRWVSSFLPKLSEQEPRTLFTVVTVSDRSDGKIAHLDGLNFSRAWCWRQLAQAFASDDRVHAESVALAHLDAALAHVSGDYAGEHWLSTFALLALDPDGARA